MQKLFWEPPRDQTFLRSNKIFRKHNENIIKIYFEQGQNVLKYFISVFWPENLCCKNVFNIFYNQILKLFFNT